MKKKLYRSFKDKKISGVCAGLAEYFQIDPTLLRVVFLILIFLNGIGVILYIILWIAMPVKNLFIEELNREDGGARKEENIQVENPEIQQLSDENKKNFSSAAIFGIILIAVGTFFLISKYIPIFFGFKDLWPLILVSLGAYLIWDSMQNTKDQRG